VEAKLTQPHHSGIHKQIHCISASVPITRSAQHNA